ncbi:relaxase/mobilization nuclease domain-containing protein [Pedobacter fastidiosus]|uniref:Relaxase/mobilization nuclease domain-containing protein n=1 Tax=Pedobacter fastidiosus TaxID=2765361 RepID=A0ABR7KRG8_9SPHI|nr:relaxase/mobilization nuclease domain-containing protein [Pedobacter fastidiosus]MBC6110696.1 relaxase/mobilization nuclease domain-containing protein [Pedobacter fastidiosus]
MIAKIVIGRSFGGCIRYVLGKQEARIIYGEGIRLLGGKEIIADFNLQRKAKPGLGKAVGHISLNWSIRDLEKLGDERMTSMALEYLDRMKISGTQVLMVRHFDSGHPHIHIVYNRVGNLGRTIPDSNQRRRNIEVCRKLSLEHGFYIAGRSRSVKIDNLNGPDRVRHELRQIISEALRGSGSWDGFEKSLNKKGARLLFKIRSGTDIAEGISFNYRECSFSGSEVDRAFSYAGLDRAISQVAEFHAKGRVSHKQKNETERCPDQIRAAGGDNTGPLELLLEKNREEQEVSETFRKRNRTKWPDQGLNH